MENLINLLNDISDKNNPKIKQLKDNLEKIQKKVNRKL
jgi:tRNA(Phe) wybutosine-synthesizing methylase Tyw3